LATVGNPPDFMNALKTTARKRNSLYDPAYEHDSCGVGLVAHIKGVPSRAIVDDAYAVLKSMEHRAGVGAQPNSGDGAGMLTALPYNFLARVVSKELGIELPASGALGAGLVFLPRDAKERALCKREVEMLVVHHGQRLIGWRAVPVCPDEADLGAAARRAEPHSEQLLVGAAPGLDQDAFERQLFLIRKAASHKLRTQAALPQTKMFYICSLSSRVMVYKGMLRTLQLMDYFPDLKAPDYVSHLAMVHARFSTNTFPSWDRAHPMRLIAHNGEINTFRGNRNWMQAREGAMQSDDFGDDLASLFPVIEPDCSDTSGLDNALEFLLRTGRSLPESILMMIPEAWQKHESMDPSKRAFYEYHSAMMEPWDGPSSVTFTDGRFIGAVLDRNGLRPSRYYVTADDRVVMASEVGVLDVAPEQIVHKGRLQPGRMFLIDFDRGELIPDAEVKAALAQQRPYADWLKQEQIELSDLVVPAQVPGLDSDSLIPRMRAFGYTRESLDFMLIPLVHEERDPVGSMGNDSALACLSDQPRLTYDYFKQLFAQVTNPAIDSIREDVIMSLECFIGPEQNLLETSAAHCHRLRLLHPILTHDETAALKALDHRGWRSQIIDVTFDRASGAEGLVPALRRICAEAESAADADTSVVILSDRAVAADRPAVSMLLAAGAVHQHLIRRAKRTRIALVAETAEASEVHHHCLLIGFGVDAINPYLALEALWQARQDDKLIGEALATDADVVAAYRKGVAKGMLKVMGKMGISTLQSYKGAQIFEAVGLHSDVISLCFTDTASRLEGVGFEVLAEETLRRHDLGFPEMPRDNVVTLPNPGEYHWRVGGRKHAWEPRAISSLQRASGQNSQEAYREFSELINSESSGRCTLRGLMSLREGVVGPSVPLEEVEPAAELVKRFCTGAMSFGSISPEAHETLAVAMNRLGGKSNTGEGGEDPERFKPMANGDLKRSAIKQVASGRFGVTAWYLANADEIQIKISQGAKPGEGGELPGTKVDGTIARIRYSTPGVGLISPPPHHDIYSIEDLAQLIYDLKNANPLARVSVKLVAEVGVGTIAAGVAKAHADHILIAGDTGGTGASPLTSIKHAGLPWELGLAETHQTLVMNDLRSRVTLQTDGGIKTGRDVVIGALLGAEEIGFSTAPLIALGCIMMRKCHLNTCPVGIATQDPELRKKFHGQPEHVVNYLFFVAEEAREIMSRLGFRTFNEMVGRTDVIEAATAISHWKASGIDLEPLLSPAEKLSDDVGVYCQKAQDHGLDEALDSTHLIPLSQSAIHDAKTVTFELPIRNVNRTVGTMLSHEVVKRHGEEGLPDGTIHGRFTGSAGQSFGAWLAQGITLELAGDANDYVGKGLSGGRIVIYPQKGTTFVPQDNVIVGNVVLYGATGGQAFFRGRAAERFAIRNSGASAVIEGLGDHGCEYMTGGRVVVLGPVGRNFAAGMSGGIAYVLADDRPAFVTNCNQELVDLESIAGDREADDLRSLLEEHVRWTGSEVAAALIDNWGASLSRFVRVIPRDYKRVLAEQQSEDLAAPSAA
jgi:glutamate synthase (NADPH/NADH) large chain